MAQAGGQGGEGVNVVAQGGIDSDPSLSGFVERDHQGTKESRRARDGLRHKAQFPQDALPFLVGDSFRVG